MTNPNCRPVGPRSPRGGPTVEAARPERGAGHLEEIAEVVLTADSCEWLNGLSLRLVEERLIACAQQIAEIRSIYRWDGSVQESFEARVAYHTRASLVPALIDRIKQEHPYEVPCILAFPVTVSNPDYADWVHAQTIAGGLPEP